jgi:hypothetical protein
MRFNLTSSGSISENQGVRFMPFPSFFIEANDRIDKSEHKKPFFYQVNSELVGG